EGFRFSGGIEELCSKKVAKNSAVKLIRFAAAGWGDVGYFAVFGDGAAGEFDALFFEFGDDFVVGEGVGFVFGFDEFAEFEFDGVPGHGFAFGVFGAAGEELAEGENA